MICQTSSPFPFKHPMSSRGAISCLPQIAQLRGLHSWLIWLRDAGVTYLPIFWNGKRLNPRTSMSIFSFFQIASNQNQTILFYVSTCTLFAIWLSCIRTGKSFEQGRWKISFALFLTSNLSTVPVRFNWSVFCTCDAFHISNSIRYFWASVSFIPVFVKVVWTLRGKPF